MNTSISVKQFIVDEFAPDIGVEELDEDYDLLGSGMIDSLGLLTVLAWAEECFGVAIDTAEVDEHDFRSVRSITSLIESSAPAPQGAPG